MMLRPMHMAEGLGHHPIEDDSRIFGGFLHTYPNEAVNPLHVTFIAYIMSVHASGFALFLFMAQLTLHFNIFIQIFQGCAAD